MTKEQYEKWSAPYRKKEYRVKLLVGAEKCMTMLIFAAYPLLLLYLFHQKDFRDLILCVAIPGLSFLVVSFYRKICSTKRPYELLDIKPLIAKDTKGKSFPSRHVFSIFVIGMTFLYIWAPLGIVIGVLGVLMAYVRVVGGVHFPKDVIAGAVVGILCGLFYYVI